MNRRWIGFVLVVATVIVIHPQMGRSQATQPNTSELDALITESYQVAFCRLPAESELKTWRAQNSVHPLNLQSMLKGHRSWLKSYTPEQQPLIVRAYQKKLGRTPTEAEVSRWKQLLTEGNTNCADIVAAI